MTECPVLTELPPNPLIVTIDQIKYLLVDTSVRTVGITVNVRCQQGLTLIGPSTVTCTQSGAWSADPYCIYPGETIASNDNPDMDETLVIIIVLSVVGFLVLALVLFVCIFMYCGRRRRIKNKKYRDSSDYYMEEMSSQPYSISRRNLEYTGYNTNINQMPPAYTPEQRDYFQRKHASEQMYQKDDREYTDERQNVYQKEGRQHVYKPDDRQYVYKADDRQYPYHLDYRQNNDQQCRHNNFRFKCPHCIQRYDEMRHAHSLNDVLDDKRRDNRIDERRDNRIDEDDGLAETQYRSTDGSLWRNRRHSYSDMNIPRPYYQMQSLPQYVAYYGTNR